MIIAIPASPPITAPAMVPPGTVSLVFGDSVEKEGGGGEDEEG